VPVPVPSAVISADIAVTDQNAAVHPADIGSSQTLVDAAMRGHGSALPPEAFLPAARIVAFRNWRKLMRQIVIVVATTALITAIISIWTTTVIIAHTQKHPDDAMASSSVDLMEMIKHAMNLADEKADPVD
jgi:hypothetical protein